MTDGRRRDFGAVETERCLADSAVGDQRIRPAVEEKIHIMAAGELAVGDLAVSAVKGEHAIGEQRRFQAHDRIAVRQVAMGELALLGGAVDEDAPPMSRVPGTVEADRLARRADGIDPALYVEHAHHEAVIVKIVEINVSFAKVDVMSRRL